MKAGERKEVCPYNIAAFCYPSERICDTCGWNPKVAKSRKEKITGHNAETCVCCGAVIPEGRQVCPICEGGLQHENVG